MQPVNDGPLSPDWKTSIFPRAWADPRLICTECGEECHEERGFSDCCGAPIEEDWT